MAGKPLDPAADFRNDGGTPAFRARQHTARMSPFWHIVRFIWLFPIVAIGAVMIFVALWIFGIMLVGDPAFWSDYWGWAAFFSVLISWEQIVVRGGGLGSGVPDFRRMTNSPNAGAWGAIATYFRSLFVLAYACYALFFWFIVAVAVWMWQSGAWARAMASIGSG